MMKPNDYRERERYREIEREIDILNKYTDYRDRRYFLETTTQVANSSILKFT